MRIDPYLYFNGNCAEAFEFYKHLLHGTDLHIGLNEPLPVPEMGSTGDSRVTHAHMTVGQSRLFGADAGSLYQEPQGFRLTYEASSTEDAERVFAGLAEGGKVTVPLAETFWAYRFGMLTDRFGIPWMVNQAKALEAPDDPGNGARTMP